MLPETSDQQSITAGQLGKRMGRSGYGVKKAIRRLRIEPTLTLGGINYYDPSIQGILEEAMRNPNKNPTP